MKVTREFQGRMLAGHHQARVAHVYLDGVEVRWCTMVDTDKGELEKLKFDDGGKLLVAGDELASEHMTGLIGRLRVTYEEEVAAPPRDIISMGVSR